MIINKMNVLYKEIKCINENNTNKIFFTTDSKILNDMQYSMHRRYELPNNYGQIVIDGNNFTTQIRIRLKKENAFNESIKIYNKLDTAFDYFKKKLEPKINDFDIVLGYSIELNSYIKPDQFLIEENYHYLLFITLELSIDNIHCVSYEKHLVSILDDLEYFQLVEEPPYLIPSIDKNTCMVIAAEYDLVSMKEKSYFIKNNFRKQYKNMLML